jgi:putative ABC transport system ATP-binding protein
MLMTTLPEAVQCTKLTRDFGSGETLVNVLRGVDFSAATGEITFLVGPSGCGKTTLISIIAGLLAPTSGGIEVLGRDLTKLTHRQQILFRREQLGFVFQQYNLLPALTAAENVSIPLVAAGMPRRQANERARDMLDRLGLGNRTEQRPPLLSGGQQQRVALARALVHEPKLIICDEPTAALDHKTGAAVMDLLAEVALHPERAVLVVTHDSRVYSYAHRIAHLGDGVIDHITQNAALSNA